MGGVGGGERARRQGPRAPRPSPTCCCCRPPRWCSSRQRCPRLRRPGRLLLWGPAEACAFIASAGR